MSHDDDMSIYLKVTSDMSDDDDMSIYLKVTV